MPSLIVLVLDLVLVLDFSGRESLAGSRALQATPSGPHSQIFKLFLAPTFKDRGRGRVRGRGRLAEDQRKQPTQNSKLKTLPSRRESPACDLPLFFGEEFVPDLWVLGLVAVVLQLRHLATDIN